MKSEQELVRIITPMEKTLLREIDKWRFREECPSRSEAMRRLLQIGLQSAKRVSKDGR